MCYLYTLFKTYAKISANDERRGSDGNQTKDTWSHEVKVRLIVLNKKIESLVDKGWSGNWGNMSLVEIVEFQANTLFGFTLLNNELIHILVDIVKF